MAAHVAVAYVRTLRRDDEIPLHARIVRGGWPAFVAVIVVFWLMVAKPALW